jgi:hypothetical protein
MGIFRFICGCAVLVLLRCAAVEGAKVNEVVLHITVTPRNVAPIDKQAAKLHWVVDPLPTSDDVKVSNDTLRAALVASLTELNKRIEDPKSPEHKCHVWYAENRGDCSLSNTLSMIVNKQHKELAFAFSGPIGVLQAPPSTLPKSSLEALLKATYAAPAPETVKSLTIVISTANSEANPLITPTVLQRTFGQLAAEFGLESPSAPDVGVELKYTDEDLYGGPGVRFHDLNIQRELFGVAVTAYKVAQSSDLLPGAKDPEARRNDAEQHVQDAYQIHHVNWPSVSAKYGGPGNYVFEVSHLHIVRSAHVKLTPGSVVAYNEAALQARLEKAAHAVEARFESDLHSLYGVIPTDTSVWKVATDITQSNPPEITGVVLPIRGELQDNSNSGRGRGVHKPQPDDDLVFQAEHRWFFSSIESQGDLAITTNANELISGQLKFSEENLGGFVHTSTATLKGGPKLQRADLDLDITRTKNVVTYGFHLNGLYLRDENQKFGYLRGPAFTDEEWGPTPNLFLEIAPSGERWSSDTRIETPFEFRHISLHPPVGLVVNPQGGWVSAFTPSFHQFLSYDLTGNTANNMPPGHFGPVSLSIDGGSMLSRRGLGGNFDFNRYSATGRVQWFAGITGPQDFLIRYARGIGMGSASMPLFELFRLGGTGNIRGIEEGEYVGRSLAFDQSEFGVNAVSVWDWVSRKSSNSPKPEGATTQSSGSPLSKLGISSIFIIGFYDRGKLPAGSSLGEVLDLSHAFHGYGVKGELRGLHVGNKLGNLSIGYAKSPNSVLHHDEGILITAFSLDF